MKTEVFTKKDGTSESHKLCRLAPGELFVSAGQDGVVILCLGKPVDEDMVRQIKEILEPTPEAIGQVPHTNTNDETSKKVSRHACLAKSDSV